MCTNVHWYRYLCGVHKEDNVSRVSRLLKGLEFLDVPLRSEPHLVTTLGGHGMYGFTDGEHKMVQPRDPFFCIENARICNLLSPWTSESSIENENTCRATCSLTRCWWWREPSSWPCENSEFCIFKNEELCIIINTKARNFVVKMMNSAGCSSRGGSPEGKHKQSSPECDLQGHC